MKGIIFNHAEAVVAKVYGEDTWDAILERAGLKGNVSAHQRQCLAFRNLKDAALDHNGSRRLRTSESKCRHGRDR